MNKLFYYTFILLLNITYKWEHINIHIWWEDPKHMEDELILKVR